MQNVLILAELSFAVVLRRRPRPSSSGKRTNQPDLQSPSVKKNWVQPLKIGFSLFFCIGFGRAARFLPIF
jgi:hypothetical protein